MIELENVCCGYGKKEIVHNASAQFEKNKISIILGPNGCGKTTLMKGMAAISRISSGVVRIEGRPIEEYTRRELAKIISLMPQIRHAPNMVVKDLLMCARYPYLGMNKSPSKTDIEAVERAMNIVGIEQFAENSLRRLSGGERQKVYIAMTLAQEARYVLLDEPTTYLDVRHQFDILELMNKLKNQGLAVIVVMHDIAQSLRFGDQIILMEKGNIIFKGTPDDIYASGILERVYGIKLQRVSEASTSNNTVWI